MTRSTKQLAIVTGASSGVGFHTLPQTTPESKAGKTSISVAAK